MIDKSDTIVNINSVERANGKIYVYLKGLVMPEFFDKQDPNIVRAFEVKDYNVDKEKGKYLLVLGLSHNEKDEEILVSTFYEDYNKLT